jgi:hypothetical protein
MSSTCSHYDMGLLVKKPHVLMTLPLLLLLPLLRTAGT